MNNYPACKELKENMKHITLFYLFYQNDANSSAANRD